MWKKLIKWFIFSVLLALLPLLTNYLLHKIAQTPITLEKLLSHGELFLIATALGATALGEIIASHKQRGILTTCSGGGCLLIVITSSMLFAFVSGTPLFKANIDISFVKMLSIIVYLSAFLTSGSSIAFTEV